MKRLDLKVIFQCNNRCVFCAQGNKRSQYKLKNLEQIRKELLESARNGCDEVVFTGGEPTINPHIIEAASEARKIGYKRIQLQSNGRMFSYLDFVKRAVVAGVNEFSPALHGHTAELHDRLTQAPGSFNQTVQGIKNLRSLDQYVLTNTVVTSENYKHLPDIARLLVELDVNQYQFAFVHLTGSAFENREWLTPRKKEIMPYIKKGIDIGASAGKKVMTEAIPYCLMDGYEGYVAEEIIPKSKVVDADYTVEDYAHYRKNLGKVRHEKCKECKYYSICEGPWKEYPDLYGWDEFKPVKK